MYLELTRATHDFQAIEYAVKDDVDVETVVAHVEITLDNDNILIRVRRIDECKTGAVRIVVV